MNDIAKIAKGFLLAAILLAGAQFVYAQFQGPPTGATPATYNVAAPINKNTGGDPSIFQTINSKVDAIAFTAGGVLVGNNFHETDSNNNAEFLRIDTIASANRGASGVLSDIDNDTTDECDDAAKTGRIIYSYNDDKIFICKYDKNMGTGQWGSIDVLVGDPFAS